ncbi:efflux RND transporter periplasmic adaptor subunit [Roseateles chitinivorans]|uniref:efflux RND transporter periplasmic adaptor subunit n=1 Tax=Roseateles chitinivorans TaxID=2917965 RepID=UPI003D673A08
MNGMKAGSSSKRLRATALVATLTIGVIALGALARRVGAASEPSAQHAPAPAVGVAHPLSRMVDDQLATLGQFEAVNQLDLRAQVGGTLVGIHFKDGELVAKGALLFSIDPRPYEIKLAQAKSKRASASATLDLAERELSRASSLANVNAGSQQSVEQRKAARDIAAAALAEASALTDDAQFDLDHCRITAPFKGRIGTHLVSLGTLIAGSRAGGSATTLLATLVSVDPIYASFDLSESDFQSLKRTQQEKNASRDVFLALNGGDVFDKVATLDFVNNQLDRASGTIRVRATVTNPDGRITPGEFARVRMALSRPSNQLLVPSSAVLPDQSNYLVLTASADGTVVPRPVQVGSTTGKFTVIKAGLTKDEDVIVSGLPYARPGSKVAPQREQLDSRPEPHQPQ